MSITAACSIGDLPTAEPRLTYVFASTRTSKELVVDAILLIVQSIFERAQ